MTDFHKKYEEFDDRFEQLNHELFARIVSLAKQVVRKHKQVEGFCMAMGTASFTMANGENPDPDEMKIGGDPVKEIAYILEWYNNPFKLTGQAVRIDKVAGNVGGLRVWFDWGGPSKPGKQRMTERNGIPFDVVPRTISLHDYSAILDSVFEMTRDCAEGNGTSYESAIEDVLADEDWSVSDDDKTTILEMLECS